MQPQPVPMSAMLRAARASFEPAQWPSPRGARFPDVESGRRTSARSRCQRIPDDPLRRERFATFQSSNQSFQVLERAEDPAVKRREPGSTFAVGRSHGKEGPVRPAAGVSLEERKAHRDGLQQLIDWGGHGSRVVRSIMPEPASRSASSRVESSSMKSSMPPPMTSGRL